MMDVASVRSLFPVCKDYVYLNNAAVAPASTRVRDAMVGWIDDIVAHGLHYESGWEEQSEVARHCAATLVGAKPTEVTFVGNTSHGLSTVAEGLSWRSGDEVAVCTEAEYPSNVYPWQHLADRGVRMVSIREERGGVTPQAVADVLTPRTRLVSVSAVQYASGHRTDLVALGQLCRDRNVLLCVDGIQQVGALPLDVKEAGIHFLSADSHKWMLGLPGIGFLYIREDVLPEIRPIVVGWKSTTGAWDLDHAQFDLRADAAKLEAGSPNYVGIYGMRAALELLLEIGIDAIAAHIEHLGTLLESKLTSLGCSVGPAPDDRAGIFTVHAPVEASELRRACDAASIAISVRRNRLRISPHIFNNEADIQAVVEVVRDALRAS